MSRWLQAARAAGFSRSASSAGSAGLRGDGPKPAESAEPADVLKHLTPAQLDAFEERAAIIEFDGGLSSAKAERCALEEVMG
jgi:hypothetical protein